MGPNIRRSAHSGENLGALLSSTNGFRRGAATKVNQDHTCRHTEREQDHLHYMAGIVTSSSSEWELNAWECVSAIGDQYNFCIKRADAPKKCTRRGKETAQMVRTRLFWNALECAQTAVQGKLHKWSGFHISQLWRLESRGQGGKFERGGGLQVEAELQNVKFATYTKHCPERSHQLTKVGAGDAKL